MGADRPKDLFTTRQTGPLGRGVTILGNGGDEIEAEEQAVRSGDLCEPGVN